MTGGPVRHTGTPGFSPIFEPAGFSPSRLNPPGTRVSIIRGTPLVCVHLCFPLFNLHPRHSQSPTSATLPLPFPLLMFNCCASATRATPKWLFVRNSKMARPRTDGQVNTFETRYSYKKNMRSILFLNEIHKLEALRDLHAVDSSHQRTMVIASMYQCKFNSEIVEENRREHAEQHVKKRIRTRYVEVRVACILACMYKYVVDTWYLVLVYIRARRIEKQGYFIVPSSSAVFTQWHIISPHLGKLLLRNTPEAPPEGAAHRLTHSTMLAGRQALLLHCIAPTSHFLIDITASIFLPPHPLSLSQ